MSTAISIIRGVADKAILPLLPAIKSVKDRFGDVGMAAMLKFITEGGINTLEESKLLPLVFQDNLDYVSFVEQPSLDFLSTAYYYGMMANGVYNESIMSYLHDGWESGKFKWLQPLSWSTDSLREKPKYEYYIDWYRRTLLIIVRGTHNLAADALTDLEAVSFNISEFDTDMKDKIEVVEPDVNSIHPDKISKLNSLNEYRVHHGFMNSARNILKDKCHPFEENYRFANKVMGFPEDSKILPIYVTGHSLGASTSSCIVYMLRKNNYPAFGVVFAPAPTFSPALLQDQPDKCRDCIVSFVNRFDVVCHLEPAIVVRSINVYLGKIYGITGDSDPIKRKNSQHYEAQMKLDKARYEERVTNFKDLFAALSDTDKTELAKEYGVTPEMIEQASLDNNQDIISIFDKRYYKNGSINLALPGTPYWIHYYPGPTSDEPIASLWHIHSHNFIDLLPFVYAGPSTSDHVAADHSMTMYLKHLRILYKAVLDSGKIAEGEEQPSSTTILRSSTPPITTQSPRPSSPPVTSQSPRPSSPPITSQSPRPSSPPITSQSPRPSSPPITSQSPRPSSPPITSQSPRPSLQYIAPRRSLQERIAASGEEWKKQKAEVDAEIAEFLKSTAMRAKRAEERKQILEKRPLYREMGK